MRARLVRIANLIEEHGLERVGEPHVKHLEGRLWEMRLKGRSGISRALYVTAVGRRVVIVRVFVKKTEKTPRHEIGPGEIDSMKKVGKWRGYRTCIRSG